MAGNLDRPLGKPNPSAKKRMGIVSFGIFAGCMLLAVFLGFATRELFFSDKPTQNEQPTATDIEAKNISPSASQNQKNTIRKRPDLPIDNNAPGIQELNAPDSLEIPEIVPRKRPDSVAGRQILAHLPDPELIEKTSVGQLPIKSADGLRALDVYSRQPDTEGNFGIARIVIIVGGLGISQTSTNQAIETLPSGVTFAFAPYGNSLSRWMLAARKAGHEILMQIPMEPFGYPQVNAGEHSLLASTKENKNQRELRWSLGRITNYVGVMNYLGGKMLTSPEALTPIFEELSDRGLMFVDDGSTRNSITKSVSKTTGLPYARAHLTIDSLRSRSAIAKNLKKLEGLAKRTGLAIGVATAFPETISQIAKYLKNAKKRGLEITPVSAIAYEPKG
ncbi:MAG: divergent polysaccharide deacetylase family protein [Hyphomicrobiales bacterium]|nr:divergent polysaccharide deacetylase family protein [Hyphomicrobiales bacterium]